LFELTIPPGQLTAHALSIHEEDASFTGASRRAAPLDMWERHGKQVTLRVICYLTAST
jgi:hypothetical protein